MLKQILAVSAVAVVVAACSGKTSLGSGENGAKGVGGKPGADGGAVGGGPGAGGGSTGGTPAWDPCSGKVCGAQCSVCPPDDKNCVEDMSIKVCDASGKC